MHVENKRCAIHTIQELCKFYPQLKFMLQAYFEWIGSNTQTETKSIEEDEAIE